MEKVPAIQTENRCTNYSMFPNLCQNLFPKAYASRNYFGLRLARKGIFPSMILSMSLKDACCEPRFAGFGINGPGRQPINETIWKLAGHGAPSRANIALKWLCVIFWCIQTYVNYIMHQPEPFQKAEFAASCDLLSGSSTSLLSPYPSIL